MLDRNEVKRKIKAGEPPLTRDALERVNAVILKGQAGAGKRIFHGARRQISPA